MLLRRITEHVKAQNWFAVGLDFLIVVVGVFIGIQVSNWNVERGERVAEIGYLEAMEKDIVYSSVSLETMIGNLGKQEMARAALYEYSIDPDAELEPAERDRLVMIGLFQLPRLDINQTTFESLKSAGRLDLIKSPTLISELQSLSSDVASALRSQADENEVTYRFSDPLLIAEFEMASVFKQTDVDGNQRINWLTKKAPQPTAPEIMKTRPFRNAILYRSVFTEGRLTIANRILDQHQKIQSLIDERQAKLGVAQ